MSNISRTSVVFLVLLTFIMTYGSVSYPSDNNQISLGYGSLTPTPTNPKWQAPSALTVKIKPNILNDFKPYLGTGLAYRLPSQDIPHVENQDIKAGVAGNAGFSYLLGKNSLLNFDYKYLYLAPDSKLMHEGKSPQLIGIGLDLKF